MKIIKISTLIPLSISLAALAFASSSWAAGTAAGTEINNTATIAYQVGGVDQTEIGSSLGGNTSGAGTPTTFVVDKKIDLLVSVTSGTSVTPGAQPNVPVGTSTTALNFTLTNEGNSPQKFSLTPSQVATTGGDDVFNTSACTVTLPTSLPVELAADASTPVTVECTIPDSDATVKNGAKSMVDLLATALKFSDGTALAETSGIDTVNEDIVFADGVGTSDASRDAKHSATNTYTINTADLTVKKTSAVTQMVILKDDGTTFETVTTNAKRIPGATIEYTITVANASGASTATGIVITDAVPPTLTVEAQTIAGGTPTAPSVSTTASAGTYDATNGTEVTTTAFDLAAGDTATLTITATVN